MKKCIENILHKEIIFYIKLSIRWILDHMLILINNLEALLIIGGVNMVKKIPIIIFALVIILFSIITLGFSINQKNYNITQISHTQYDFLLHK